MCQKFTTVSKNKEDPRGPKGDPRTSKWDPRGSKGGKSGLASRRNCIPRKSVFLQKSNRAWRLDETYNNKRPTLGALAHSAAKRPKKWKTSLLRSKTEGATVGGDQR